MGKQYMVCLWEEERAQLPPLVGSGRAATRSLTHARSLLTANQGEAGPSWSAGAVAAALDLDPTPVAGVRKTYGTDGLAAALHRQAPDRE